MKYHSVRRKLVKMISVTACLLGIAIGVGAYRNTIPNHLYIEAGSREASNIPAGAVSINYKLFGIFPIKTVAVDVVEKTEVIPCGAPVGIYMKTDGILVVGTGCVRGMDGLEYEPAANILRSGDYIMGINDRNIDEKEELIARIQESEGREVVLNVRRKDEVLTFALTPVETEPGEYKLGVWVRDDTQGIGTMTYLKPDGEFGALGHGISDIDTGALIEVEGGALYTSDILSINRGERGAPGEVCGVIKYRGNEKLGSIRANSETGIYGKLSSDSVEAFSRKPVEIAYKQEIKEGPATILSAVSGEVREYDVLIQRIDMSGRSSNKSMVVQVTDPELLKITGGIVQGMSGSPILQNGKLVGAVTHVFINDPRKGYGIFIENML